MTAKNNIPKGYKYSAVGIIPQEWEVKFFKDVCTFLNGRAYKQEELLSQGKYPVLRVGNFFTNTNWYYSDLELDKDKYAVEGDLLYAWSASFGPRFWNGEKVIYHYHIWKVVISSIIDKLFLYDYLEMDARKLYNQIQGGTMAHITKGDMEQRYIPVPPMEEQRKIAEILGVWDEAIEKQSRLIEKLELRKRALMQHLLTGRIRLPGFTTPWQKRRMKDCFEHITDTSNGCEYLPMTISARLGLISQKDKFDRVIAGDSLKKYTHIQKGDFAYNKGNSNLYEMGCIYRLKEQDAVVPFVYICFRPKQNVIGEFYQHFFINHGLDRQLKRIITSGARGDGLLNVDKTDFFELEIVYPPIAEQKAIAEVLTVADNEIATHRKKLDALRLQKRGLMQQLLTGKTRVKI
ncbi:MAG: hypothetical protein E7112_00280 [Bacteroidales bacterium]|nr:hypothetical protein [Bacteroidales bacterium]